MTSFNRLLKTGVVLAFATSLSACGGGGGGDSSDGQLTSPYTPSVTVQGLAAPGTEVVSFTLNGATINASANGVYPASATVIGNYSAALLTSPAGKTCAFNGVGNTYSGSSTSITLVCVINTTPGGGGGVVTTPGAQPAVDIGTSAHQSYAWGVYFNDPDPLISTLVSLTNFSNVGLTNATPNNFVFYEGDVEVQTAPTSEFRIHVQPINEGVVPTFGSIAVDISSSFTSTQIATMKQEINDFFTGTGLHQYYRLTSFDDEVVPWQNTYINDVATLQAAVAAIPEPSVSRASSTNILGATAEAALSADEAADYVVIITDGSHTSDAGQVNDIDVQTVGQLMFVIAIGANADFPLLEDMVTPTNEDLDRPARVLRIADVSQVEEALQTIADYVSNMTEGLHVIHYLTPRRAKNNMEFTFTSSPADDCSAENSLFPCGWDITYDATTYDENPALIYVFSNAMFPLPGDQVTLTIPDWGLCSPTPNFSWSLNTISGSATLGTPSADGRQVTVTLGGATVNNIEVLVTDTVEPTCSGSYPLITPSYTVP